MEARDQVLKNVFARNCMKYQDLQRKIMHETHPLCMGYGSHSLKSLWIGIKWYIQIYKKSTLILRPHRMAVEGLGSSTKRNILLRIAWSFQICTKIIYLFWKFTSHFHPKEVWVPYMIFVHISICHAFSSKNGFGTWLLPQSPWDGRLEHNLCTYMDIPFNS